MRARGGAGAMEWRVLLAEVGLRMNVEKTEIMKVYRKNIENIMEDMQGR